jgi:hypothetical protein
MMRHQTSQTAIAELADESRSVKLMQSRSPQAWRIPNIVNVTGSDQHVTITAVLPEQRSRKVLGLSTHAAYMVPAPGLRPSKPQLGELTSANRIDHSSDFTSRRSRPAPMAPAVTFPERSGRSVGSVGGTQPAARQAPVNAEATARRFRLARPTVVTVLCALVVVLFGLGVTIGITAAHKPVDGLAVFGLFFAGLGLVIARRQPGNRIAWLLLGFSVLLVFYEDAAVYSATDYRLHGGKLPLGFPAVLIASELWSAVFLMLPLIILFFPDGKLPPRWRMVMWGYLGVCALIVAILLGAGAWQMRGTRIVVQGNGQLVSNSGPTGALGLAQLILFVAVPVFWVLFVARQVLS